MPRPAKQLSPLIFLDEIDVLQMAFAAIEMAIVEPLKETFGLLIGGVEKKKKRTTFRVYFVQVLQRGERTPTHTFYSTKLLERLRKRYNLEIIGSFHSHPDAKTQSRYPSHVDLDSELKDHPTGVFAILHVEHNGSDSPPYDAGVLIRRKSKRGKTRYRATKIVCIAGGFKVHFYFYVLKERFVLREDLASVPRNLAAETMIRRVYPRCYVREKIHKKKLAKVTVL